MLGTSGALTMLGTSGTLQNAQLPPNGLAAIAIRDNRVHFLPGSGADRLVSS